MTTDTTITITDNRPPETFFEVECSTDYGKTWNKINVSSRSPLAAYQKKQGDTWPYHDDVGHIYRDVQA